MSGAAARTGNYNEKHNKHVWKMEGRECKKNNYTLRGRIKGSIDNRCPGEDRDYVRKSL